MFTLIINLRNRVKGLTEVEDGNISAEAGIQGPGAIVDGKNELCFTREARSKTVLFRC